MMKRRSTVRIPRRPRRTAGYSLIEVLFASFLLLVVAVSIIPMFTRALESNLAGGRASAMASFAAANLEEANQKRIDHEDYDLDTATVLGFDPEYWSLGDASDDDGNKFLGDEVWQSTDTDGLILWERNLTVRKYAVADILPTVSTDGSTVTGFGEHPRIFDLPLKPSEESFTHLVEFRVEIKPHSDTVPVDSGQRMTISHFRTY